MKKEELLEIGLTEEQADKVFAMNGKDIEKHKRAAETAKADLASAQAQLADRDKDLAQMKAASGGMERIQQQFADLQSRYAAETGQYKAQLEERDYADAITRAIARKSLKFSSKAAERAFIAGLKAKKLELKDGELSGLDDYIKAQKAEDPDAFAPDTPALKIVTSLGGSGSPAPARKTPAEQIAEEIGRANASTGKASGDIISMYTGGKT